MVESRDELWYRKRKLGGPLPEPQRVSGAGIHMPNPSYWPLVTAVGVFIFFVGFMFGASAWPVNAAGAALTLFGIFRWAFEPID